MSYEAVADHGDGARGPTTAACMTGKAAIVPSMTSISVLAGAATPAGPASPRPRPPHGECTLADVGYSNPAC